MILARCEPKSNDKSALKYTSNDALFLHKENSIDPSSSLFDSSLRTLEYKENLI